jgi:hypothetical protein
MLKFPNVLILLIQIAITFTVLFSIYIIFAILDNEAGLDGFLGLIINLLFGGILSVLTILICLIAGLPIRLNKTILKFWSNNFYISIILALTGLTLLFLSLMPQFLETVITDEEFNISRQIPNMTLQITGWFVAAFSTLHVFAPDKLKDSFRKLMGKTIHSSD